MRRLRLLVAYDGTPFRGWQSQKHGGTVQDELEAAFHQICGTRIAVVGAGRTDAGVHALGQSAHADVPPEKFTPARWCAALNGIVPSTIRVLRAQFVAASFHARFSAREKTYRYRIINGSVLPPLELNRAWQVKAPIDLPVLKRGAVAIHGRHDFAGFAANRGRKCTDTVRTIRAVQIRHRRELLEIEVTGDGFLYKMVRLLVGTLIDCATGRQELRDFEQQLETPAATPKHVVAPAAGLYLVRVRY